jgi:hypothetical protein
MGELAGAYSVHHGLIVWAIRVLGGIAGVLEDDVVGDAEYHFDIGDEFPALHLQGVLVDLPVRGDPNVYSCLLSCELV